MSQNRLLGIANPQNTKGLGHFLTTDCKSVETPNGRNEQSPPGVQKNSLPPGVPADLQSAVKKRFDL